MPRLKRVILLLAAAVPPLLVLSLIVTMGSKVPMEDQWDTPGSIIRNAASGRFHWMDLFIQHNEARKAFSSLIWLGLSRGGWDCRLEMAAAVTLFVLALAFFAGMLGRSKLQEDPGDTAFLASASILVFTPFAMLMWLWGVNVENAALVFLLVCGAAMAMRQGNSPTSWASGALFSTLATFTFANGFCLWIVLCPLWFPLAGAPGRQTGKGTLFCGAAYLGTLVGVALFYAHGYAHPSGHPSLSYAFDHPGEAVLFFLNIFGSPLGLKNVLKLSSPVAIGLFCIVLGAGLAACVLRASRSGRAAPPYPWLILCGYSLLSVAMITVGRVGMDFNVSGSERYYNHTIPYHLGVIGLLLSARKAWPGKGGINRVLAVSGTVFYLAVVPVLVAIQWPDALVHAGWIRKERLVGEAAISFSPLFPRDQSSRWLTGPREVDASVTGADLARLGVLDLPLFPARLASYTVAPASPVLSRDRVVCRPYVIEVLRVDIPAKDIPAVNGYLVFTRAWNLSAPDGTVSVFPLGDARFRESAPRGFVRYAFPLPPGSSLLDGGQAFNSFILSF